MNPALVFGRALDAGADQLVVHGSDGDAWTMPIGRWLAPATAVDERVLARASGPVLDVGCGPGRHVHALARRGVPATGVEIAPAAVRHARRRGADVVEGSIFEVAPRPGWWATALLLDGNIGIGGRPAALLGRIGSLLGADGQVLVEVEDDLEGARGEPETARREPETSGFGTGGEPFRVRIEADGTTSAWFAWARVTTATIAAPAAAAGMRVVERWSDGGRHFCALARA